VIGVGGSLGREDDEGFLELVEDVLEDPLLLHVVDQLVEELGMDAWPYIQVQEYNIKHREQNYLIARVRTV